MRRKDREVADPGSMLEIMRQCDCCRLGLRDGDGVYIVPLNFGFCQEDDKLVLYFHGAGSGRKIELLKACPQVGFEMDTAHGLGEHETACGYSYHYASIMGTGRVSFLEDHQEKLAALGCILAHYSDRTEWEFSGETVKHTAVLRLEVTKWSCKRYE